jgi:hypothetical protein
MQTIPRIFTIFLFADTLAVGNNLVNPREISWVGNWPTFSGDEGTVWVTQEVFDRFVSLGIVNQQSH